MGLPHSRDEGSRGGREGAQTHWAVSSRPAGGDHWSEGTTHLLSISPSLLEADCAPLATQPSLLSGLGRQWKLTAKPWAQVR